MAKSLMLCDIFVALLCFGCIAPAFGITGFRNQPIDQLRQISFNQQGQILSDVQQHQHRFGGQGQLNDPITQSQSQNSFSRQNIVPINQQAFSQNPSLFVQAPTGFQQQLQQQPQLIFQQPIITNDQSFLPLPPSIQQVPTFFQQSQQSNGHQQQITHQQPSFIELPKIAPQPPTQNSFLPTIPTQNSIPFGKFNFQQNSQPSQINNNNVLKTNNAEVPFQSNLGVNPLFSTNQNNQLQSILDEQRKEDLERLKELQERQKIIQKHKQFLDRQQQKQQQKVHKLHEEFTLKQKKKQEEIYATAQPELDFTLNTQSRPRGLLAHEVGLFQKAVKQYEDLHPTTPIITTTTTTTTQKPKAKPKTRLRAKSRSEANNPEIYLQNNRQKLYKEIKTVLQNDDDAKKGNKDSNQQITPSKLQYLQRQDLLKQLKLAIAENSQDYVGKNFSSREISLPTGEKFQLIKTSDPNLIAQAKPLTADSSTLTEIVSPNQLGIVNPSKLSSFEDITKGVLPPGTDFEVIKQSGNGKLEEVGNLPSSITNKKKVTFVFIEEQGDGSYKVKGVRGNEKNENQPNLDVDNILQKINEGKIQLPAVSPRTSFSSSTKSPLNSIDVKPTTYSRPISTFAHSTSTSDAASIYDDFEATKLSSPSPTTPNYYNSASPSSLSINHHGSPQPSSVSYDSTTPSSQSIYTSSQARSNTERNSPSSIFYTKSPPTTVNGHQMYSTSSQRNHNTDTTYNTAKETIHYSTAGLASPTVSTSYSGDTVSILPSSSTYYPNPNLIGRSTTPKSVPETAGTQVTYSTRTTPGLVEIFKENGLFATAKYLKQSGLDAILNETGPYTIFAPTDKAFRTLLIQLGGPDKAEEKFKENPRLLSGLLLHHVIPGAFEISTLQDEMTGVSLAGTQLRVNQYDMHDVEWNEIKVTTVNGARIITEKQDINIPQGIAHAVDRVMFPLPVGDIVQTLQADRERRFTNFLKALFSSSLIESLSDTKTYTVFAPTDRAFSSLKSEELQKLVSDKETAKEFVMKHITPGTLFSAGMRYYQVRDSMDQGKPITLQKNAGRIKVNSGHVITHNIPSTNGVIHAIDTLL